MRRNVLISGAAVAAGIGLPLAATAAQPNQGAGQMNTITTKDDTQIYTDPQKAVPGNVMPFPGVADAKQRAEIIDYLKTVK